MRITSLFTLVLWIVGGVWAMPALERSYTVRQPDGSTIEVIRRGNEHFNYETTPEGEILDRDSLGYLRKVDKKQFLSHHIEQYVTPDTASTDTLALPEQASMPPIMYAPGSRSSSSSAVVSSSSVNSESSTTNALVVLVQFNDTKFSVENTQAAFDSLFNGENYSVNNNVGSVRSYFVENSMGAFRPHFDVYGPVTVSGNNYATYGQRSSNGQYGAQKALIEALSTLNSEGVDFSKYDNDGDGIVDYVHMIFAGFGAHDSGLDSAIWPHEWTFSQSVRVLISRKSYYFTRYSCSSELDGYSYLVDSTARVIAGVGHSIHELGHLLGLTDLYSNNETGATLSPGSWDVMATGAYNTTNANGPVATSPPYYTAFERFSLGWLTPTKLNVKGNVKLGGLQNNVALYLANPSNKNEYFLMEYRTKSGWDKALLNHGMLIWHIDYSKAAWDSVRVNTTAHQHVDIEEADGIQSSETRTGDVFPGASKIRSFDQFVLWDSTDLEVALSNITENRSYTYVTFDVNMDADSGSVKLVEAGADSTLDTLEIGFDDGSSSSEIQEESSSSEELLSSSSESLSSSSVTDSTDAIVANGSLVQINSHKGGTLLVFSLNGQLLASMPFTGSYAGLDLKRFRQPLLLSVRQGSKITRRTLFIFRE